MKIVPVAFDSMGARSMATYVETGDVRIFIDPSVALGPRRYGLPPHRLELRRKEELWERIKEYLQKSDVVIITHYHYDHHNPAEVELLEGKRVFVKHPEERINRSQMGRARKFLKPLREIADVEYADGKSVEIGDTLIEFSPAVPHGTDPRLGYVVMVMIDDGRERLIHTSDVEGASLEEQIGWLRESDAEIVFMDGPMTYMLGYRFSETSLEKSVENVSSLMGGELKTIVLDHHLTRDLAWRERVSEIIEKGEELGVSVESAATFAGLDEELLEARRKELYSMSRE
ncbi:MBL fold metallo-hydrolase [Geoglobus ahangari]|uniref:MBL fold metallo-hydrolase n=1 Tax=Geoglobus ahangari TaxID=113653 RepID=UPI00064FAC95|nr:MBL fold metallo-hydrolase [Geoglobus ahangari]